MDKKLSVFMPGLETESGKLAAQKAMHSQYVLQLLHLQRRAGFLCDITVNVEDKSFKAHKPLLAACSLYFRALFADSAQTSSLNLSKVSPVGFEVLLDYIYSGSLAITSDNSDQVLYAANCLQMTNVVETCLNFIRSSFQVSLGKDGNPTQPDTQPPASHLDMKPKSSNIMDQAQQIPSHGLHGSELSKPGVPSDIAQKSQLMQPPGPLNNQVSQAPNSHAPYLPDTHKPYNPVTQPDQRMTSAVPIQQVVNANAAHGQQPNEITPTNEAINRLMPYLIEKNARRPTLNEVRQLLINGSETTSKVTESQERYTLKQTPPALIAAYETQNGVDHQFNTNNSFGQSNEMHKKKNGTDGNRSDIVMSTAYSVASNTTNRTTACTENSFNINNNKVTSHEMQPFVLITPEKNVPKSVESCKGRTWSEDRSMMQDTTDLSGTPCSADLTKNLLPINTQESRSLTSPASSMSSPRIQISPASVDSYSSDISPAKNRWCRALSLDLSSQPVPVDRLTSRSVGSKPINFSPEHIGQLANKRNTQQNISPNNRISAEEANNAVGALFVGSSSGKTQSDSNEDEDHEESNLMIAEDDSNEGVEDEDIMCGLKSEQNPDENGFPVSQHDDESDLADSGQEDPIVKRENGLLSVSPPPVDDTLDLVEEGAKDLTKTPSDSSSLNSTTPNKTSSALDFALDLSLPKGSQNSKPPPKKPRMNGTVHNPPPVVSPMSESSTNGLEFKDSNPKMQEALNALVMMQNSMCNVVSPQSAFGSSNSSTDENSLTSGFSRKPRRSSGGQTCQWPGCGRLFRHRNIYDEHQKLHEMGVPVTQLRKCYMGARVKKTARERLEEMRMTDGSNANQNCVPAMVGGGDEQLVENGDPKSNRTKIPLHTRKRKSVPIHREGNDRKRVTLKDKRDHYIAKNQAWQKMNSAGKARDPQSNMVLPSPPTSFPQHLWPPTGQLVFTSASPQLLAQSQVALISSAAQQHHQVAPLSLSYNLGDRPMIDPTLNAMQQLQQSPPNAVAATLAALGIQLPVKKGSDDIVQRSAKLDPPSPAMTLDELRRRIALRDVSIPEASDPKSPGLFPQSPMNEVNQAFLRSPSKLGNVTGIPISDQLSTASVRMSVPNPYHDQTPATGHGPTCS